MPPLTPDWPDDPETVEEARANPDVLAKKTLEADRRPHRRGDRRAEKKPAVMGHSTGGLLAQMIADRGLSAATVAIDPGPFRGVLPLPVSALRSAAPVLKNPLNRGRAVTLTLDQFKYGWANALDDEEAKQLYDTYHVAAPGVALMQMANANLNPWTEAKLDPKNPDRGPLLIIDGEKDHTVPWAIANASYKRQKRNAGGDRDQEDPEPRSLADDRLAAGARSPRPPSTSSSGSSEAAGQLPRARDRSARPPDHHRVRLGQRHRANVGDRLVVLGGIAAADVPGHPVRDRRRSRAGRSSSPRCSGRCRRGARARRPARSRSCARSDRRASPSRSRRRSRAPRGRSSGSGGRRRSRPAIRAASRSRRTAPRSASASRAASTSW